MIELVYFFSKTTNCLDYDVTYVSSYILKFCSRWRNFTLTGKDVSLT